MKNIPASLHLFNQNQKFLQYILMLCLACYPGILLHGQGTAAKNISLDSLAIAIPALNSKVDITVSSAPVQEFLRGLASQAGINMNIDPTLNFTVSNNFNGVRVRDVLQFLNENYDIEIKGTGNILNIRKRNTEISPKTRVKIETKPGTNLVSITISQVPIRIAANEITEQTGQNIIVTPSIGELIVNYFIRDMPLIAALEKMAIGNNFSVRKTEDGVLIFEPVIIPLAPQQNMVNNIAQKGSRNATGSPDIKVIGKDSIRINAQNCRLEDVINKLFPMLNKPYNLMITMDDIVSLKYEYITFDALVQELFAGSTATFKIENGGYRIGKRNIIEMEEVLVVQLKYRTIDSIVFIIPNQLKKEVDIKQYPDMNSLVLSGAHDRVKTLAEFIQNVDKRIPVVLIEVLIIDNKNSKALSTGISAGLSDKPTVTKGTIAPSVDLSLGSSTVNEIIDGLNGFGWVNLGKVKPNFYMTLKALEQDGIIELKSTPQLSTLNGHKAKMSIGNTEYYKEELNNIFGSMTTQSQVVTTYKPIDAELSVSIRPIVDGSEQVTLDIKVEQSDFTARISEFAPPGKVSRKFESLIRIKDQEMILLGGLEEKEVRDTRSGFPILSRIPILNWIFSSREKSNSKSKLNIFIKPTIIY
jgi:type IV pilus assembly protein PilQ